MADSRGRIFCISGTIVSILNFLKPVIIQIHYPNYPLGRLFADIMQIHARHGVLYKAKYIFYARTNVRKRVKNMRSLIWYSPAPAARLVVRKIDCSIVEESAL